MDMLQALTEVDQSEAMTVRQLQTSCVVGILIHETKLNLVHSTHITST